MRKLCAHAYHDIISLENLLGAWEEFVKGKRHREDVQVFEQTLMHHLIALHHDLATKAYRHAPYEAFVIADPKHRQIHKATVRDRLVHHALHRVLYPYFDRAFIAHSYACRKDKGVHRALDTFRRFARVVSRNHTRTVWVLKCDVQKFFASIDHGVLMNMLRARIPDTDVVWLVSQIIESFMSSQSTLFERKGLPLGNLTSQLFANMYLDELDQYMKHVLKAKCYIRYADDFVVLSDNRAELVNALAHINTFLAQRLKLVLHPHKVSIQTIASGVDFLGWVHFPDHRVLRTVTARRMMRRVHDSHAQIDVVRSYLGLLSHGNARKLCDKVVWLEYEYGASM